MLSSKTGGGKFSWENVTIGKQMSTLFELSVSDISKRYVFGIFYMIAASDLRRLGLYREAEKQFRSALNHQEVVDTYLYLAKVLMKPSYQHIANLTNLLHNVKYSLLLLSQSFANNWKTLCVIP